MDARLEIPPLDTRAALALEQALGVSFPIAQILTRRGLSDPVAAQDWLDARDAHAPGEFAGIDVVVAVILRHVAEKTRITVHGDYDVDGVTSTAILVGVLRDLGADVDWFLPSRTEDGYGLARHTVERLAARGTKLLVTVDCAITAVDEVAHARSLGLEVVVTDHHRPRNDGVLPFAPIVHPALCDYPCADLCAAGVAYKLAQALLDGAGADVARADEDLDLVALATIADCVPLVGENRRLVREGLAAIARTRRPGLQALLRAAHVEPGTVDARTVSFRLAPRINAAGRLYRADAGLELMLTEDPERAALLADELDHANSERRHTEERIRFAAEAQVAALPLQPAYVLAGEDWHPGVIGIVAARIAERHNRPTVLIALDGDSGTGSGRSIPAFDLLAGLDAGSEHLLRHGGHRAAAGCSIAREEVDAFRAAFVAHAAAVLRPQDLIPVERVDAVVAGDELGTELAEELTRLAPFGIGNPAPSLLVPAARLVDARPMGEGKHVRFTVESGGVRARAVAFGMSALPDGAGDAVDATFGLELNEWNGAVEPRLVLRRAMTPAPGAVTVVGEPGDWTAAVHEELSADLSPWPDATTAFQGVRDRRGGGAAGVIAALVASGEPVLVVCADSAARARHLEGRLGGFALTSWTALERAPQLAAPYAHVVALDPPPHPALVALLAGSSTDCIAHLAWGEPELRFAEHVNDRLHRLREPLVAAYRALRDGGATADALPRHPALAGRLLRVLCELGFVELAPGDEIDPVLVPAAPRTALERSSTFRACEARYAQGDRWLRSAIPQAA